MFKELWKLVSRLIFIIGIALTLLVLVEFARAFAFFYRFDPALGWSFLGILGVLLLAGIIYLWKTLRAYPTVLKAPELPPLEEANHHEMRRFCNYLVKYLTRLSTNPQLSETHATHLIQQAHTLREVLGAHPLNDDLKRAIQQTEETAILPALAHLREAAQKEIRRSVRDVMLGVTLSPYHSIDLIIVLYRNAAMTLRIARKYASRPTTKEQFLILRDVLRVIVTINFLYIGRNLLENLFAHVPVIGKVVDDIGQGLGAGLFTSAAGHAAIGRCEAYKGWSKDQAADTLAMQTKAFLTDVRNIFTRDVLPDLHGRIRSELPESAEADQAAFWDKLTGGITTAVDMTGSVVGNLVIKPAMAGTKGVVKAGSAVSRSVSRATSERRGPLGTISDFLRPGSK